MHVTVFKLALGIPTLLCASLIQVHKWLTIGVSDVMLCSVCYYLSFSGFCLCQNLQHAVFA